MSLAIKFGDNNDPDQLSGFIYFDVVTKYSKQLSGKVTAHPLDAGANITDHYISENPKYNLVGVISSADISGIPSRISVDGESPLNVNPQSGAVIVNDSFFGVLSFIPDSGSQFMPSRPESVSIDSTQRTDYKDQINTLIAKLMTGLVYNEQEKKLRNRMTLITLYEFVDDILTIESEDLVMTGCSFEEDPDTGTGLFVTMSLEQVSFVTLEKTELPKDVSDSLSKASKSTAKKSKADGTEKKVGDPTDATSSDPGPRLSRNELNELELREAKKARDALKAKKS
jgi:hypothetical protein